MRRVPASAARQFGAFTTRQALAGGWTPSALKHAERYGSLERLRRGVYGLPLDASGDRFADAAMLLRREAAAVSLANPRVPISHGAAALLHGTHLAHVPRAVCVTYPRGRRDAIGGAHRHRGVLHHGDVRQRGFLRMLSVPRCVVDIGCESGADDAIVAADTALRAGLTTTDELLAALDRARGWPGVRGARLAVLLADPRAESALESISRLRIAGCGLPAPEPQVIIRAPDGTFAGRVDLYWDEFGVVGEADGFGKYTGVEEPLVAEKRRQGRLEDAGLIVVRWGWADLAAFDRTARELERAFARGSAADRPARRWGVTCTAWPRARSVS